jgi:hypothetical protein
MIIVLLVVIAVLLLCIPGVGPTFGALLDRLSKIMLGLFPWRCVSASVGCLPWAGGSTGGAGCHTAGARH